ncbi:endonuclease/exonuclease/phosphatase family protein [Nocardioides conyzicola]|uniref:Endonuclease/exonuclease/phosphatase domain-containing protein n=1 Tax=Nocardioides conyzicola TaxID=1651781 RepID=A0ABP8WYW3_9ACTN
MGEDGAGRTTPGWVHNAASVAVGLLLVAVPVVVVAYGHFADDDKPTSRAPVGTPSGPTPSGSVSVSSAPTTGPSPDPLPTATGETCVPGSLTNLTVVSFNIESAHAADGSVQLELLARTLKSWKPDVVLLQEVDKDQLRTGRVDMASYLGQKLGFSSTFGPNMAGRAGGQYGTALLSRYPIKSVENTRLPRLPGDEQRGLLHAVLDVDGADLSAYVVHLQHTSTRARMSQITTIRRLVARDPLPKVMGGDFNAHPGSSVMAVARTIATDTWPLVGSGPGLTVPRIAPRARIDYLLQTGLVPVNMQVLTPPLSDHRALWARYGFSTTGAVCLPSFG